MINRDASESSSHDRDGVRATMGPDFADRASDGEVGLHAVILAGGEGLRLRQLTRYVSGDLRPKQFARLLGGRSLLRQTLDRTAMGIPWDRTVVVAQRRHARYVAEEFADLGGPRVLMQPEDRGTAAAILLAAHWISWRTPAGVIAVFPSDHFIEGEGAFMSHVRAVADLVRGKPDRLVLLGVTATDPEPQYGWIERGPSLGQVGGEPLWRVRGFVEKPPADGARVAWARGDLWNTFVVVGAVATLLQLGWEALPALSQRLADIEPVADTDRERAVMERAYAGSPAANFSRVILEPWSTTLAVSRMPRRIRWSDWGTPERVIASLQAASLAPRWLRELDRGAAAPA